MLLKRTVPHPQGLRSRSPSGRSLGLAAGLLLTLVLTLVSLLRPPLVVNLDGRYLDQQITGARPPAGFRLPVVVALDDASLARFGRWPWPRARVAELLTRIAAQRPASVGIDIIFAEPEAAPGEASPGAGEVSPGDRALERALASGPFVLGYEMAFSAQHARANLRYPPQHLELAALAAPGGGSPLSGLWEASGALASRPQFLRSVSSSGFVNASFEPDGVMRRMPVLIREGDRVYPSLALAAVLRAAGAGSPVLSASWTGELSLDCGALRVPLDDRGRLLLRYRGWQGGARPVSAAALLEGRLAPDALQGRVVLLGATATGMGETVTTPARLGTLLSGVQVHAVAAENLLNGDCARSAPWPFRPLATLLSGGLASLACALLPVVPAALATFSCALFAWFGAAWLFQGAGIFLSPVLPVLALAGSFSVAVPIRYFYGERRNRLQARDLELTREFIMTSLSALTEIRDTETGAHILRTQRYLRILCEELAPYPRYRPFLDPETIDLIAKLAPLHDIGKVGLPDHLLHKTSAFTREEYEEVKQHTAYGRDTIERAEQRSGVKDDPMLRYAKDLAYSHHERWDGSGYPLGLKGEQIPWAGRIMAIADTYDALISRRVYKDPIPREGAVAIILAGKGSLFDPDVVDAFEKVESRWWQIACELLDPDETLK